VSRSSGNKQGVNSDAGGPSTTELQRQRMKLARRLARQGIDDRCVLAAIAEVPRERFVVPELADRAYQDRPLPIGHGQTISAPWIVAFVAHMLELNPASRVLEVGAGSGYAAAVMSRCCAKVTAIERLAALAETARATVADLGYANVDIRVGDGHLGAPDQAPFDAIAVSAMAYRSPPAALLDQLAPGGTLVCPVGSEGSGMLLRIREGRSERLVPVAFVPLVEATEHERS
jgi:protein-L-isoaspartate(D-aspartate) O-methyltransferase